MARYFFDIHNGDGPTRDEHGIELPSPKKILEESSRILLDIARDELPGEHHGAISITVRDDQDNEVCTTQLKFQTDWR